MWGIFDCSRSFESVTKIFSQILLVLHFTFLCKVILLSVLSVVANPPPFPLTDLYLKKFLT